VTVKRLSTLERFQRGDDSILNADSSAERRLLEGVGLIVAIDAASKLFSLDGELKLDLDISLASGQLLPENYPGRGIIDTLHDSAPAGALRSVIPDWMLQQEAATNPYATAAKMEEAKTLRQQTDGGDMSALVDLKVPLRDALIAVLMTGYVIEKSTPVITKTIEGVGSVVGGVAGRDTLPV